MNEILIKCKHHGDLQKEHTYISNKNPIKYRCRICQRQFAKNWQLKNKGKYSGTDGKIQATEKSNLKKRNKITLEDYNTLLLLQDNKCAICLNPEKKKDYRKNTTHRLSVDHNHETGKIRGLLCSACNIAFGLLQEDINVMNNMIKYKMTHG